MAARSLEVDSASIRTAALSDHRRAATPSRRASLHSPGRRSPETRHATNVTRHGAHPAAQEPRLLVVRQQRAPGPSLDVPCHHERNGRSDVAREQLRDRQPGSPPRQLRRDPQSPGHAGSMLRRLDDHPHSAIGGDEMGLCPRRPWLRQLHDLSDPGAEDLSRSACDRPPTARQADSDSSWISAAGWGLAWRGITRSYAGRWKKSCRTSSTDEDLGGASTLSFSALIVTLRHLAWTIRGRARMLPTGWTAPPVPCTSSDR